ncbi:MAG: TM0106 family RecB-like putative nuclease, partial [Acidimicrobiales bacterium]|nr:TM0106 family RecB-like putative nuclease [Acidimicrobiales bacterium]
LWGTITVDSGEPVFTPRWAHDRAQERRVLCEFLDWLADRRATPGFEGLHVYHYAPYEVTALKRLVGTFGTHATVLDRLLRDGVFVDLYAVVRRAIRISEGSYSIKRLEPLTMGDEEREGDVADGGESVAWYAEYQALAAEGDAAGAQQRLDALARYNDFDCLSTLRLRDWLRARPGVDRSGSEPSADADQAPTAPSEHWSDEAAQLADELLAPFRDVAPADRTPAQQATAMVAAGLLYHRREELPFWWGHFARLAAPLDDLARDGEALVLPPHAVELVDDWHLPSSSTKKLHRRLRATVELAGGYKLSLPGRLYGFYGPPAPGPFATSATSDRAYAENIVVEAFERQGEQAVLTFTESLPAAVDDPTAEGCDPVPVALSATGGPSGRPLANAVLALARTAFDADGELVAHPALDVLARRPPRLVGPDPLPVAAPGEFAAAIEAAVRRLDRSYLAVQGPPGTGKTWTGARVIAALVADGWKVGVVAQGHRTIEQLLDEAIAAGVAADRVVKRADRGGDHGGRKLGDRDLLAAVTGTEGGLLVGGTSYDMVSDKRVPAGSLDLLVVDEAGQFSLADTLAVSRAAPRLLLLGDPQQLPQVSQANHPDPIDRAALAWLADGHDTLPAELGYFLDTTYRLRPELCTVVSRLSYDGQLGAAPEAAARRLDGVVAGVVTRLVDHADNQVRSVEEADEVLGLVKDLVGRTWIDPGDPEGPRPLGDGDILVVAPYNAQVNLLRQRLDDAGHEGIRVGSVDKFQGAQAPVVIVSMAASSARSGRGSGFVLSRNRLNVAISRAQHTACLVHAPQLTDVVPSSPRALVQLGAFLGVSHAGRR